MPTAWPSPSTGKNWTASVVTVSDLTTEIQQRAVHLYEQKGNVRNVVSKTTTYTVLATDGLVLCNGTFTVALPSAATVGSNHVVHIKNIGTGAITIDPNGAQTIDGSATLVLTVQYDCLSICSDGSNWHII